MSTRCRRFLPLFLVCCFALCPVPAMASDLFLKWIGFVDNMEGDNPPHGPSGSFHLDIYDENGSRTRRYHLGKGVHDGDELAFENLYLGTGRVIIRIWESDTMNPWPGVLPLGTSDWGGLFGRKHDVGVYDWVSSGGIWWTTRRARPDAIENVRESQPSWLHRVWNKPVADGIPTLFFEIEAKPEAEKQPSVDSRRGRSIRVKRPGSLKLRR